LYCNGIFILNINQLDTISVSCEIKTKPKPKTNKMRLIVDSGSTKADWIAINEEGKVLFTTQTKF
jgi:hypothetical protein